jgi:ATP-dependent DNA helicase RecG
MGTDDASRTVTGVTSAKYAKDNLIQAARLCQPPLVFVPPTPQEIVIDGRKVVYVYVPPGTGALIQAGGVFWGRRGSQTVPLTRDEVIALSFSRGLTSWETQPVRPPATLATLDPARLAYFLRARAAHLLEHGDEAQALQGLAAAVEVPGRGVVPTGAGLLMFADQPQTFLPQAEIDCVLFRAPGTTPAVRGGWVDRRRIVGALPDLIERALDFVARTIPTAATIVGTQRADTPAYPLEAVREAIVNAVVHRDYALEGQMIRVFVYHDHLEVRSPGRLLPGVTIDLLLQGRLLSKARNPILAGLLRDWPEAHYIERLGAGMRLMLGAVREAHLPPLRLEEFGDEFVVTFYAAGATPPPPGQAPPPERPPVGRPPTPPPLPGHPDPRMRRLNKRQLQALVFVREQGGISNAEYRTLTNTTDRTAGRELAELRDLGLLIRQGGGNQQRYVLPNPDEP